MKTIRALLLGFALAAFTAQAAYTPVPAVQPVSLPANTVTTGTFTASDAVVAAPVGDGSLLSGASTAGSIVWTTVPDATQAWTLLIKGYVSGTIYTEASNNTTNGTDGDWVEVKGRRTGTAVGVESVIYAMVSNGYYRGNIAGFKAIRARLIGATGPSVTWTLSQGMGATFLNSGIPAGSSVIGKVSIDQTTPGTTNLVSAGLAAGSARVGQVQLTGGTTSAALGLGSTVTAYGSLRVTPEPTQLFNDPFDGSVIDTTNRWNAPVVSGFTVTQANGGLTVNTNTTANNSAFIDSQPTFAPLGINFTAYAAAVKLEAQTGGFFVTNQDRFWGIGTRPATFAIATPYADDIGFEVDTTGQLQCVVYSNGTKVYGSSTSLTGVNLNTLVAPSNGYTRFGMALRADTFVFYIGSTEYPACTYSVSSAGFTLPNVQALPIRIHAINAASVPSGTSQLIVTTQAMGDTGGNANAINDATYGWRKAVVTAAGALKVDSSGTTQPVSGPLTDTQLRASPPSVGITAAKGITISGAPTSEDTSANIQSLHVRVTNASIPVTGTFWQTTQPVSSANIFSNGASAISAVTGSLTYGQITTAPSGYSNNTVGPISIDTAGNLRVSATQAAITKGTQGTQGVTTQDLKDAGRTAFHYYTVIPVAGSAAEALLSLTGDYNNALITATTTPAVVPAGKTRRITKFSATYIASATSAYAIVRLRANPAAIVTASSNPINTIAVGSAAPTTANAAATVDGILEEGFEVPAGYGIGITMITFSGTTATAGGFVYASVSGYDY